MSIYIYIYIYIYDKAFNESGHAKLESLQNNATLAITAAIRGSSNEKIYETLEFMRQFMSPLNQDVGTEKLFFCIKSSKVNQRHTFLILYQIVIDKAKQEIQATLARSLLNMVILRIFFPSPITE